MLPHLVSIGMASMRVNFALRHRRRAVLVVNQNQADEYSANNEATQHARHVAARVLGLCFLVVRPLLGHLEDGSAQLSHPHKEEHASP